MQCYVRGMGQTVVVAATTGTSALSSVLRRYSFGTPEQLTSAQPVHQALDNVSL